MTASTRSTSVALAIALGVSTVVALAAHTPAYADDSAAEQKRKKKLAKQYVDAALAAQEAGDYAQAVALYEKAYDVVPHPLMFFNIGQAQRLAGNDEEALTAYERYLADDPGGAKAKEAQGFVKEIKPRVERARAEADERARLVAETEAARAEAERIEAERQRLEEEAREREEERAAEPPPEEPVGVKTVDGAAGAGRRKLGLIVGGGGAVVAVTGAVFGFLAMDAWSDSKAVCGDDRVCDSDADTAAANARADDARRNGNLSTVFVGVGAVALVAGGVMYLTAPSGPAHNEHAILVVPSADGAILTWSGAL